MAAAASTPAPRLRLSRYTSVPQFSMAVVDTSARRPWITRSSPARASTLPSMGVGHRKGHGRKDISVNGGAAFEIDTDPIEGPRLTEVKVNTGVGGKRPAEEDVRASTAGEFHSVAGDDRNNQP